MNFGSGRARDHGPDEGVLAATPYQRSLLSLLTDPGCTQAVRNLWTISRAILVRPKVNARRLNRGYRRLLNRHDVLRLRMRRGGKTGWQAYFAHAADYDVITHDLGDCDDRTFAETCNAIAGTYMPLEDSPLIELHLLRCGGRGDVVMPRVNHLVSDGFGMVLLAEDLIKLLVNFPLNGKALTHRDYVQDYLPSLPGEGSPEETYWDNLLADPPLPAKLGTGKRRVPEYSCIARSGTAEEIEIGLDKNRYAALEQLALSGGSSVYSLLSATFAEVIADISGADDILIDILFARSAGALSNYLGMHAHFAPIRLRLSDGKNIEERASVLARQIMESASNLTRSNTVLYGRFDELLARSGADRLQFCVHTAAADAHARSSKFSSLLMSEGNQELSIGPMSLTVIPLHVPVYCSTDLMLEILPHDAGASLNLQFDPETIAPALAADIAAGIDRKIAGLVREVKIVDALQGGALAAHTTGCEKTANRRAAV